MPPWGAALLPPVAVALAAEVVFVDMMGKLEKRTKRGEEAVLQRAQCRGEGAFSGEMRAYSEDLGYMYQKPR